MRKLILAALFVLVGSSVHAAEIQTSGPQVFPGKMQASFDPIAFQVGFRTTSVSGYKLAGDIAGLVGSGQNISWWVGGGFNSTFGLFGCYNYVNAAGVIVRDNCGYDLQFWAFAMMTFEKLIKIPLVPFVRFGVAGEALIFNDTGGAFGLRFGGGVHYYLTKNIGLGVETNFTFGPAFIYNDTFFYGTWDFGIGARFAF